MYVNGSMLSLKASYSLLYLAYGVLRGDAEKKLKITAENMLDNTFNIDCSTCGFNYCHAPPRACHFIGADHNKLTEVNLQDMYHTLVSGEGQAGMERCAFLGVTPITPGTYVRHCRFLSENMDDHYRKHMKTAHEIVMAYYKARDSTI